jgi:hypothetical protein
LQWQLVADAVERRVCKECGNDSEDCGDPDKHWFPQLTVCYATMEASAANWRWDQLHGEKFHDGTHKKWRDERSDEFPYGHRDGVSIFVAPEDHGLGGDFLSSGPL